MNGGWIKLYRTIQDHWIWQNPLYLKLWCYCLLKANHEPAKVLIGSHLIELEPGEFITSYEHLALDNKCSIRNIRTFVSLLEKDEMITRKSNTKSTKITICNYKTYQEHRQATDIPVTNKRQTNDKQTTTNKNNKEVKNDKNKNITKINYADFVSLTEEEFNKLNAEYGHNETFGFIEILNNYKGSSGKKYKSDYMTIRSWVIDKYFEKHPKTIKLTETKQKDETQDAREELKRIFGQDFYTREARL